MKETCQFNMILTIKEYRCLAIGQDGRGGTVSVKFQTVFKPVVRFRIRIHFGRLDKDPDPGGQK